MPHANNNGTQIYWEEDGHGEPVLLIMGLGVTLEGWRRLRPSLSKKYRVILFDNRGVGRSGDPSGPFSVVDMARDANAVMVAAGIECAHVIGASMGGMIAQELALHYPEKIRSLILAVTMCGGPEAILADAEVLLALRESSFLPASEAFWAMAPYIYASSTPRSVLEDDLALRHGKAAKPQNFLAQARAIGSWPGTFSRLSSINARTFVIHGAQDRLIVPENGRLIARTIPNARLVILENASHMFIADQTGQASQAILDFLAERK